MTIEEIKSIVESVSGMSLPEILECRKVEVVRYKYVFILMVFEELSYDKPCTHQDLSEALNMPRPTLTFAMRKIDEWLSTNREFKKVYKACIKRMAEMEGTI